MYGFAKKINGELKRSKVYNIIFSSFKACNVIIITNEKENK